MGYKWGFVSEQWKQELEYARMKASDFPFLLLMISLLNRNSGS